MSFTKKIVEIISSVGILFLALILLMGQNDALEIAAGILCLTMLVVGIRYMVIYFTMARYMVDGRKLFYYGLIILDMSFLCGVVLDRSHRLLLLYLVGMHAFYGVVQLLRALEEKKYDTSAWKFKLLTALINLGISVACIFFIRQESTMAMIFGGGLIYTAVVKFITAFRKEENYVIQ